MLTVKIPQYDFGYREQFTIYTDGRQLNVKDLTGYKAYLTVWDDTTAANAIINREIQVASDPTTGVVYWEIQQGETDIFGNFRAEIRLTQEAQVQEATVVTIAFSTMQFSLQIIPAWQGIGEQSNG